MRQTLELSKTGFYFLIVQVTQTVAKKPKPVENQVAAVPKPPTQPAALPPIPILAIPNLREARPFETPTPDLEDVGFRDGKSLTLNLEALEITWVVVSSDDGEPHEALLQPGEKAQWHARDHFIVTLGNAGGVHVKVDGMPRGPFGKPGTVVRDLMIRR